MRQVLLLVALALFGAGAAVGLVWSTERRWSRWATHGAAAVASVLVAVTGAACVSGAALTVDLGNLLDFGQTTLRLDPLAGLFLTLTGSLGALISSALMSWCPAHERAGLRAIAPGYMLLLASVTVAIAAADAFTFLFAWEALTVSFYVLSAATRRRRDQPAAAWATAAVGKAGGAALLVGFLLLAGLARSFGFSAWAGLPGGGLHATAYALVVFGFGTKVGLAPFQVWMPRGYPAAPGPVRAAMAGLAVNAGFYGLWRFLALLGRPPEWLAAVVLVLGGVTALLGIAFAAVQADINRVIAYSSAENGGIIMVGFGVALAGAYVGNSSLVAVGLLAGSLQALAHAVAKTGLFLGAANFEAGAGSAELGQVSGLARSQPWGSASFAASALTLAGLPPTIGFVSEWFIFEALMQQFRLHPLTLRLATAGAGALIALTAGVAALTFVRLLGFSVLGRPPSGPLRDGGERGALAKAPLGVIAASCFGLAAVAPWAVRYIARGLSPDVARSITLGALKSPWVLQPVFPNFSALSTSWLFVVMPLGFLAVTLATVLASRGRFLSVRHVPVWRSASPGVHGEDSYTAFAYANPVRHVLANILGTQKEVAVAPPGPLSPSGGSPVVASQGEEPWSAEPTEAEQHHPHVVFKASVAEPVESYLYRPIIAGYLTLVRTAKRLQSGRLEAYVGYMLVALVAVLIVAASMH
jgi:formate hydrogenlyase subunit 3/multisubunit Na+/H+ antiporter MnhD subunit